MTLEDFRTSLGNPCPPNGCSPALAALWHDAKGDWEEAHRIAQAVDDEDGAWVHAYLHRKEGDSGNARHWYRRAARTFAEDTLLEEWNRIAAALLSGERAGTVAPPEGA
jgi:hypothetical protein